ncbi:hypothetical protein C8R31_101382 [Nitrosospira sp. Nsp2]|nr:hypothetical protein C8R31_101382 [Nitrosospira sp. Nsp2]
MAQAMAILFKTSVMLPILVNIASCDEFLNRKIPVQGMWIGTATAWTASAFFWATKTIYGDSQSQYSWTMKHLLSIAQAVCSFRRD